VGTQTDSEHKKRRQVLGGGFCEYAKTDPVALKKTPPSRGAIDDVGGQKMGKRRLAYKHRGAYM